MANMPLLMISFAENSKKQGYCGVEERFPFRAHDP